MQQGLGQQDALRGGEPLGDVTPGEADQIGTRPGSAHVVSAIVAEDLVEERVVVEDHRLPVLQAPDVSLVQLGALQIRRCLQLGVADEIALLEPEIQAGGSVDVEVPEVDHPSGGFADRLQQHLRIEHAVGIGAQQGLGRVTGCHRLEGPRDVLEDPDPFADRTVADGTRGHMDMGGIRGECPGAVDFCPWVGEHPLSHRGDLRPIQCPPFQFRHRRGELRGCHPPVQIQQSRRSRVHRDLIQCVVHRHHPLLEVVDHPLKPLRRTAMMVLQRDHSSEVADLLSDQPSDSLR